MTKINVFEKRIFLLWFLSILLTSGCVSGGKKGIESLPPSYEGKAPEEMVQSAKTAVDNARAELLDFYSPNNFAAAKKALERAQKLFASRATPLKIAEQTSIVEKKVTAGLSNKEQVIQHLSEAISQKERLDELNAEKFFAKEYKKVINELKKAIVFIEKQHINKALKYKPDVLESILSLEIKTVKHITIDESEKIFGEAGDIDAKKLAAKTYEYAAEKLAQAKAFIENDPKDAEGIAKIGKESLRASQHALYLCREVVLLSSLKGGAFEDVLLDFEKSLHRISLTIQHEDVRYMPLTDQFKTLAEAIGAYSSDKKERLVSGQSNCAKELGTLTKATSQLQSRIKSLEAQLEATFSEEPDEHTETENPESASPESASPKSASTDKSTQEMMPLD